MSGAVRGILLSALLGVAVLLVPGSGASPAGPYATPPESRRDLSDLRVAFEALDRHERAVCLAELERLIPKLPAGGIPRHAALVLHGQLTGAFAARQAAWLDRQVADVVVLVPDEASFIEAVRAWEPELFWPVLIDDDWYAPLFVEAFEPKRVVRWAPPEAEVDAEADDTATTLRIARAIRQHNRQFNSAAATHDNGTRREGGDDETPLPPGIVVLDPHGPQRAAGLALALARRQPILALGPSGDHQRPTTEAYVEQLNATIMAAMNAMGMLRAESWSGITLAGNFPYLYNQPDGEENPLCVDDRLGRDGTLIRHGVTGRLVGDSRQAVYQAMASLFLQPRRALLADTYGYRPDRPMSGRGAWHLTHAANELERRLGSVTLLRNDRANVPEHRRVLADGEPFDLWWINSSGGGTRLNMSGGGLGTDDVPVGRASAMYLVASFSARNPWDRATICATALAGGAYWCFGSVHEPYLQAFPKSTAVAHRAAPPTPLAFAARHLPGDPFHRPWKLILIGDPLFALRPGPAERVDTAPPLPAWEAATDVTAGRHEGPADTPGRRLIDALLARDPGAVELAEAAARAGAGGGLAPRQLAQAVRLLYGADRGDVLAALSPSRVSRHPIAGVYMRRMLRAEFEREMDDERLDAARDMLGRLLGHGVAAGEAGEASRRWVEAMRRAERGGEAARLLLALAENEAWPRPVREALRSAIERPAGE